MSIPLILFTFTTLLSLLVLNTPVYAIKQNESVGTLRIEPEMIYVAGGDFTIGCLSGHVNCEADERVNTVSIAPFYIGKYEVTNAEFVIFLNAMKQHRTKDGRYWIQIKTEDEDSHILRENGTYFVEPGFQNYPVIEVSWRGATRYSRWLSETSGNAYRLPTESEWEVMARAARSVPVMYPWGITVGVDNANCDGCSGGWDDWDSLQEVGLYPPNALGIYDVVGNVWEWTCSRYDPEYRQDHLQCDSAGKTERKRALRGGSWLSEPWDIRLSNRAFLEGWRQDDQTGFRLLREVVK